MPSRTKKQARTMAMAAHDAGMAKKMGIPQGVAREYNRADEKSGMTKKMGKGKGVRKKKRMKASDRVARRLG